jgi:superfamily II DNA/RNA helicase
LTKQLVAAGIGAVPIHGSRTQGQREAALAAFSAGRAQALVATDVAARGIHVDDVACVVHFDPPADEKDYVHRSGRTGRAGADGMVVSLVGDDQIATVRAMQRALGLAEHLGEPGDASPSSIRRPSLAQVAHTGAASVRAVSVGRAGARSGVSNAAGVSNAPGVGRRGRTPARATAREVERRPAARLGPAPRRARDRSDESRETMVVGPHVPGGTDTPTGEGAVKWFDPQRGFGFIAPDSGGRDVFVHKNQVRSAGVALTEGQRVAFALATGTRGPEASDVRPA